MWHTIGAKRSERTWEVKAAVLRRFGPPDALRVESVPDPVPSAGEVVIDVAYASVTFVETQLRAGRPPKPGMGWDLPVIPGNGVGGTVDEVGPGVDSRLVGQVVVSTTGGSGGYAERVAVNADDLIGVPDGLPLREAVALLADGRTALALSRRVDIRRGDAVFVTAAAGGVGTCLVQLARSAGAAVIAGVGAAHKMRLAEKLGATLVVDYSQAGWEQQVRESVNVVDVVFDGIGGATGSQAIALLGDGGRVIQYGMASGSFAEIPPGRPDVRAFRGIALTRDEARDLSAAALSRAAAGELAATIGQQYTLDQVAEAHAGLEARATVGKTLLRIGAHRDQREAGR